MKAAYIGLFGGVSILSFMMTGPVLAQSDTAAPADKIGTELSEIIVTAQKRSENLQQVPIAVVSVSGNQLQERGIYSLVDLTQTVPGLAVESFNGVAQPFLRGVGTTAAVSLGPESSVATYVDGVYFSRLSGAFFDLTDVDRVEVLKGPQGTLFGRNSTGGVINIITLDPSLSDSHAFGSIGYGNFGATADNVYGTAKLSDTAAVDLAVSGSRDNGWGRNLVTGNPFNYENNLLLRSKFLWEPSDATKLLVSGFYDASAQDGNHYPFPGTTTASLSPPHYVYTAYDIGYYNTTTSEDGANKFQIWGLSARLEQDVSFAKLISITAFSHTSDNTYGGQVDYKPDPGVNDQLQGPTKLGTEEIQLQSKEGGPFNWVLGYYYYNNFIAYTGIPTLAGAFYGPGLTILSEQKAISNSGFAQVSYQILPKLKLTAGIRYTAEHTSASGVFYTNTDPPFYLDKPPVGEDDVDKTTYRGIVDYQFTDDVLGYVSYNSGFKSGTFNLLPYSSDVPTKPEDIDAYEIGIKSEWFDRRIRLNAALFDYQIKDPQVQLEFSTGTVFSNAGGSRVRGGEAELETLIVSGLVGRVSYTYIDSKYTDYMDAPATMPNLADGGAIALPPINASGHHTPLAPTNTLDVGVDYTVQSSLGKLTATADYYYNDGYYFEPDNLLHQPQFSLVNAQIKQELTNNFAIRLWGKNLFNKQYVVAGSAVTGNPVFGYQWTSGAPRTYGVAVDFKF